MSVDRCLQDEVRPTGLSMRNSELAAILQSDTDVSSALVFNPGSAPSIARAKSNSEMKPRVEDDDSQQTFVVTDLLDGSQYIVVSEPSGSTIIVTAGPVAVVTTGPNADVTELASRTIRESRIQEVNFGRGSSFGDRFHDDLCSLK